MYSCSVAYLLNAFFCVVLFSLLSSQFSLTMYPFARRSLKNIYYDSKITAEIFVLLLKLIEIDEKSAQRSTGHNNAQTGVERDTYYLIYICGEERQACSQRGAPIIDSAEEIY